MDNVFCAVIMTQVIARVHPVHLSNADQRQTAVDALRPGQPTLAASPPVGCYGLHTSSPFIITRPES